MPGIFFPHMSQPDSDSRWTVGWGFTSRCDLRCPFCYSAPVRPAPDDVSLDKAVKFLKRNRKDIRSVNFGTGESFLSPDFPDLLELCAVHIPDAEIAVTTNGALAELPDATLQRVGRCLTECDISLDFSSENAHDNWRGRKGTWRRAVRAAQQAKDLGCRTSLVMVGTRQTLTKENLEGMMSIAADMRIVLRLNMYMPTFGDFSFSASADTVWKAIHWLSQRSSNILSSDRLFGSFLGQSVSGNGSQSCRILPSGGITPSTYLIRSPWIVTDGFDQTTLSTLADTEAFQIYADPALPAECEQCERVAVCQGGSVERRWLWTGSLENPDPMCPMRLSSIH